MATRRTGFGGGLGYSLIRARRTRETRPTTLTPTRTPQLPGITPQRIPSAGDVDLNMGQLSGGVGGYDVSSDPAVAMAAGLAAKSRALAQATALAKRKQAAIEYGDPTGIEGIDEQTAKAARENPFSILKNLEHSYQTGREDLEEGLNAANLFYGGYRGKQLGEAARGYEQARYGAGTQFRGLMSDINENLSRALLEADFMEAQSALGSQGGSYSYGGDGGGGGGSGIYYDPNRSIAKSIVPAGLWGYGTASAGTPTKKKKPTATAGFGGGLGYALTQRGAY